MAVVEADAHGIIADGLKRFDFHRALAAHGLLFRAAMAHDFGARRLHAQIFGGERELLARVVFHAQCRARGIEAQFNRPWAFCGSVRHEPPRSLSESSRASSRSMMGM